MTVRRGRRAAGGFIRDFQDFILRGNVVDLAVAVIIGTAFGKVVDSVVSLITDTLLDPVMKSSNIDSLNSWPAGQVIVAVINFLIIAFVIFLIVRALERFKRKEEVAEEAAGLDPVDVQQRLVDTLERLNQNLESRGG